MRTGSLLLVLLAALAVRTPAQHPMGFTVGWDQGTGGTTLAHNPQLYSFAEGDILTRIDHDDYRGWGLDPVEDPSYSSLCLSGLEFVIEDPDLNTAETPAWITAWSEDPNNPNHPDVPGFCPLTGGSNFLFTGPIPANTSAATAFTFTFASPLPCVSKGQDVFLGLHIGPEAGGEGLWVHAVNDENYPLFQPTVFDNPGPAGALIDEGSYVCIVPTQGQLPTGDPPVYTSSLVQNRFEVYLANAAGGVCITATNQTSYEVSSLANGGTPNFISGLHPDASSTPVNEGRTEPPPAGWTGDQIGFIYSDSRLQPDDPVAVFFAFEPAPFPIPLNVGPASTGQILIHPTNHALVLAGLAQPISDSVSNYVQFSLMVDLPSMSRAILVNNHPTLLWQAAGLDSSGSIHLTGMVRQHY